MAYPSGSRYTGIFTPPSISGLKLWLKADAGVYHDAGSTLATNGQTVQQWNDQSGSGKNATQSTSGQRPTYVTNSSNGMPGIRFLSSNNTQLLAGGNSDFIDTSSTLFIVYQNVIAGTNVVLTAKSNGAGSNVWYILSDDGSFNSHFNTTTSGGAADISVKSFTHLLSIFEAQRVNNTTTHIYRNGVLVGSGGDGGNSLNSGTTPLGIGNDGGTGQNSLGFDGFIYEIIYYNSSLTNTQRSQVEQYLENRWAIPVSTLKNLTACGTPIGFVPPESLVYYQSIDGGCTWTTPSGVTNPLFTFTGPGGVGTTLGTQATSSIFYKGTYFTAYGTQQLSASSCGSVSIASAPSPAGPWTYLCDATVFSSLVSSTEVWTTTLFFDDDGSVHLCVDGQNGGSGDSAHQIYILDALNSALTSWSSATLISGTGIPANTTDHAILTPAHSPNGFYNIVYKDDNLKQMGMMSSSSLKSGYTITYSGASNHFGLNGKENMALVKMGNIWRMFYTSGGDSSSFIDSFDNWTTWLTGETCSYPAASNGTEFGLVSQNSILIAPNGKFV